MNSLSLTLLTLWSVGASLLHTSHACNELTCAPIVSKCMITKSCNCDYKACTCCRECYECLSYLFAECCDCFGLCPEESSAIELLSKKSHVEDLEGIPGLFSALTGFDEDGWTTTTYPVRYDAKLFGAKVDFDLDDVFGNANENERQQHRTNVNCTVVFMAQCLSWNKCKSNCQNMGATSYRWFHDGCCECVGSTCINYGINESQCADCSNYVPEIEDDEDGYFDGSDEEFDGVGYPTGRVTEMDYGDLMGPMDDGNI